MIYTPQWFIKFKKKRLFYQQFAQKVVENVQKKAIYSVIGNVLDYNRYLTGIKNLLLGFFKKQKIELIRIIFDCYFSLNTYIE